MDSFFKVVVCIIICFSVNQFSIAQLKGDTYTSAKEKKSANWVLTYAEAPGFASKNSEGDISGICVDIMNKFEDYVEQNHGIKVNVTYQTKDANDFTKFLDEVKAGSGGVFGLSNTTITEGRKSEYNFSPPYITNIGMILSNISVPTLIDMPNISKKFKGMTAITVKNSTNEKRILDIKAKYYPNLKIEYVPSFAMAMASIINDNTKFTNVDFTYYFEAIQNRKPVKRHPGGDDTTEQFGIIMPKSNDWAPLLEEFMNSGFLESVEYKKIISDNLGLAAMRFFETLK